MGPLLRILLGLVFLTAVSGNAWTQTMAPDIQQRKDIEKAAADLGYLSAKLKSDQKDLAEAQVALRDSRGRLMTYQELLAIQDRIQKDTVEIQNDSLGISRAISFLRLNWSGLTQDEKTLVLEVEQTQM